MIDPCQPSLGLFAEYVPEQDKGFSVAHAGLQSDVNLLASPWYGRVAPLLSLGAGALWTDRADESAGGVEFPLANESTTTFALAPSHGARVQLWRQLGLRADVRDVITFRDRTLHNVQFAAGLSFPF